MSLLLDQHTNHCNAPDMSTTTVHGNAEHVEHTNLCLRMSRLKLPARKQDVWHCAKSKRKLSDSLSNLICDWLDRITQVVHDNDVCVAFANLKPRSHWKCERRCNHRSRGVKLHRAERSRRCLEHTGQKRIQVETPSSPLCKPSHTHVHTHNTHIHTLHTHTQTHSPATKARWLTP